MRSFPRLAALACLLLAGCTVTALPGGAPEDDRTQADYEAELARLSDAIDEAIGEARAENLSQCRILEVGVRPCGGPWEYRVFSTAGGDPGRVLQLTAAYNDRNEEMNRRFELVSTCEYREPPEVVLEGGRCTTRTR